VAEKLSSAEVDDAYEAERRVAAAPLARLDAAGVASLKRRVAVDERPTSRTTDGSPTDRSARAPHRRRRGGARSAPRRRRCRSLVAASPAAAKHFAVPAQPKPARLLRELGEIVGSCSVTSIGVSTPRAPEAAIKAVGTVDFEVVIRPAGNSSIAQTSASFVPSLHGVVANPQLIADAGVGDEGGSERLGAKSLVPGCERSSSSLRLAVRRVPSTANSYGSGAEGRVPAPA
jgi:hypothetical protein